MAMLNRSSILFPIVVIVCFMSNHSTTTSASSIKDFTLVSSDSRVGADDAVEGGELIECWDALAEIKSSCTTSITAYLTNGTADIGAPCCVAITEITHSCWPALLTSIGFSVDQGYVLRGYCDAAAHNNNNGANAPSPTPIPSVQPI